LNAYPKSNQKPLPVALANRTNTQKQPTKGQTRGLLVFPSKFVGLQTSVGEIEFWGRSNSPSAQRLFLRVDSASAKGTTSLKIEL
jgi:pyridoxine/pyridoxamine 5'-phosphate oxidase